MALAKPFVQGAFFEGDTLCFRWFAPEHRELEVVLYDERGKELRDTVRLTRDEDGVFTGVRPRVRDGALYKVRIDGEGPWPDPFSRSQPMGVHGPSQATRLDFTWRDEGWRGTRLEDLVISEVHVGTATPDGTFDALSEKLDHFVALGVTAIELLPVASFPGTRNWGYDGVSLFAPSAIYGGPDGLARFIDRAHRKGLAVILDCVYNHFGPDGNYLGLYSKQYFDPAIHTPWGAALATDLPAMREMLCTSAEAWVRDYHADGLRLDATHAIPDRPENSILREIATRARKAGDGREIVIIAEDERNESRLVKPESRGGCGLDAVWADDFHHQLRRAFAGDHDGYFADFTGAGPDIAHTINAGWFYRGQRAPHLGKARGTSPEELFPPQFVYCIQNHDQVGNRAFGDRLGHAVSPEALRAMSAILLLSPATPLLFLGEEWNASTPFQYFTDHEPNLGKLVSEGRRREFKAFASFGHDIPDPQADETFSRSKVNWNELSDPKHASLFAWYRELLRLRRKHPAMQSRDRRSFIASAPDADGLVLERRGHDELLTLVVNLRGEHARPLPLNSELLLSSADARFGGRGEVRLTREHALFSGPGALVFTQRHG